MRPFIRNQVCAPFYNYVAAVPYKTVENICKYAKKFVSVKIYVYNLVFERTQYIPRRPPVYNSFSVVDNGRTKPKIN